MFELWIFYNQYEKHNPFRAYIVAGPCGAGDVSGGTAGERGSVSGSVECCSPVAAAAAGSTRTWA